MRHWTQDIGDYAKADYSGGGEGSTQKCFGDKPVTHGFTHH